MSYLQDRKKKNNKIYLIGGTIAIIVIILFFKVGVFRSLGSVLQNVGGVLWKTRNNVENIAGQNFLSKAELYNENQDLKQKNQEIQAEMQNYQAVVDENTKLKEAYGRKVGGEQILSAILVKPGQTVYDTLIIDVGTGNTNSLAVGKKVYADGDILIGEIAEIYANTSKVKLYSSPGEKLSVIVTGKDITAEAVGRGGGNFEMSFPQNVDISKGTEVTLPGITPYLVGIVDSVISDSRDPLQKVLLRSPVNVQELKFVEVEK